jgi:magnesium chelatase subunit I
VQGVIPAITGKVELVYEGEQEGAGSVAEMLIEEAIKSVFPEYFPKIEKIEKKGEPTAYDELLHWFFEQRGFELLDQFSDAEYRETLDGIPPLNQLLKEHQPDLSEDDRYFVKEMVLWGLVAYKKLSKQKIKQGIQINDLYSGYLRDL